MTKAREFYTVRELSAALDLPQQSLTRYLRRGEIRGYKVRRFWRIPADEYSRLTEQGTITDRHGYRVPAAIR